MDQEQKRKGSPLVLVLIIIIVLLAAAAVVLAVGKFGGEQLEPAPVSSEGDGTPTIGYEEGVTALDEDTLQKAVDEAYRLAAQEGVAMSYQNDAFSKDGSNVTCYIANPAESPNDIYIGIYADSECTDELYLSKLIPPGSAKKEITLNRRLIPGSHLVYLVYTQVEDDRQTIRQQAIVTMDLHVDS